MKPFALVYQNTRTKGRVWPFQPGEGQPKMKTKRMKSKPIIVCLCGSTRFKSDFEAANLAVTMLGAIVVAPGVFGHADGIALSDEQKRDLDELHLRKIDMADVVFVIAPKGYVGISTKREIEYAEQHRKPVVYWPTSEETIKAIFR